jgi:cobalt-zinc-cadmium efflux system protein
MAHYRKPLAIAAGLNAAIFIGEAAASVPAHSLSLLMDGIHNLSDQLALVFLYLAFVLTQGVSRNLLRSANILNSIGLILVSGVLLWQAAERFMHPTPIAGGIAIGAGLGAAIANWGVAQLLREPSRDNAAVRLAYIHNLGDVYVSLAPVAAGLLVGLTGNWFIDPIIAAGVAVWFIVSTALEAFTARDELIWPEKIVCGHKDHDRDTVILKA